MFGCKWRMMVRGAMLVSATIWLSGRTAYARCRASQPHSPPKAAPVVETANFRIYGIGRLRDAARISADFESERSRLARAWLGRERLPVWSPKCDVVVHATVAGYLRAVGQDRFATVGSSRTDTAGDRVTLRRLDILANQAGWFAASVPHELTHLIMADEFRAGQLPVWADEGMAVLADTPAKQSLHVRDFNAGQQSGSLLRLVSFMAESGYPSADKVAVFYGQSVSLVKYLVDSRSPADFVRFLHRAEKVGYDAALGEVYGVGGVHSLQRECLASTFQPPTVLTAEAAQDRDLALVDVVVTATTTP